MTLSLPWRRLAALLAAGAALLLGACSTPPAFQVSEPSARVGSASSVRAFRTVSAFATGGVEAALVSLRRMRV